MCASFRRFALGAARDERGATATELALVLPIFVAMVFGTYQFGVAQHRLSSLRYALTATSRAVMLNPALTQDQVSAMVKARLTGVADPNVNVTLSVVDGAAGKVARLTGTYSSYIGIPMVASYPLNYQTTVDAALPEA